MKNKLLVLVLLFTVLIYSCGINNVLVLNHNWNNSVIQLGSNNFKVANSVNGNAEVSYVIFGGLNKKLLYENANSAMLSKANLQNTSRAIIHVVAEEHIGGTSPF